MIISPCTQQKALHGKNKLIKANKYQAPPLRHIIIFFFTFFARFTRLLYIYHRLIYRSIENTLNKLKKINHINLFSLGFIKKKKERIFRCLKF